METKKKESSPIALKLENSECKKIEVQLSPLEECPDKTYLPCNPSICKFEEGYLVVCRTVNYDIDFNRNPVIQPIDLSESLKTKNILVHYDRHFNKIKEARIVDHSAIPTFFHKRLSLEDYRIFNWHDELWFLSTTHDTNIQGTPKKVLGKIKNLKSEDSIELENLVTIDHPCTKWGEKNWLPFIMDNKLHAIYSFDPLTVFHIETDGTYTTSIKNEHEFDMTEFRGSAAPIPFQEGYLALVHEHVSSNDKFNYFHRFVYLDANLTIKKVSDRFTFMGQDVEFVCGMALDDLTQKLVIGLGVWDKEAYLCFIDTDYVSSLLQPLTN